MNKLPIDLKDYRDTNALTAIGLLLRWAGIIAFLLIISINLDKVL